jgi:hypothetical protein
MAATAQAEGVAGGVLHPPLASLIAGDGHVDGGDDCDLTGVDIRQDVLIVPAGRLPADRKVAFALVVTGSFGRQASDVVTVITVPGAQPLLVSLLAHDQTIAEGDTVRLQVVVSSESISLDAMYFIWEGTGTSDLDLMDPSVRTSRIDSPTLVIAPYSLSPGAVYNLRVQVVVTQGSGATFTSWAGTEIEVVKSPVAGVLLVSPAQGFALVTPFLLSCVGSASENDESLPLEYRFGYYSPDTGEPVWLSAYSTSAELTVYLPDMHASPGLTQREPLTVVAAVRNSEGGASRATTSVLVEVSPDQEADASCFLASAVQNGPLSVAGQTMQGVTLVAQLAAMLNDEFPDPDAELSCGDGGGEGGGSNDTANVTTYSSKELREVMFESLSLAAGAVPELADPGEALLVIEALETLTNVDDGTLEDDTWDRSAEILVQILDTLDKATEGDAQIMTSLAGEVASNLLEAGGCERLQEVQEITGMVAVANMQHAIGAESRQLVTGNFEMNSTRVLAGDDISLGDSRGEGVAISIQGNADEQGHVVGNADAHGAGQREFDVHTVRFGSEWSDCRGDEGEPLVSDLVTVEVRNANGSLASLKAVSDFVDIFIPLKADVFADMMTPLADCPDQEVEPLNPEDVDVSNHCGWRDEQTGVFETDGCVGTIEMKSINETFEEPGVNCKCSHLTEFALLRFQAQQTVSCEPGSIFTSSLMYLLFAVVYLVLFCFSGTQLVRLLRVGNPCKHFLVVSEHALMAGQTLIRMSLMAIYFRLHKYVSFRAVTLLVGLPHLVNNWLFSLLIVAWAALVGSSSSNHANPFDQYRKHFFGGNTLVIVIIVAMLVAYEHVAEDQQEAVALAGATFTAAVSISTAVGFAVYGFRLVHSLTKNFVSAHAAKLFRVSLSLTFAFVGQSVVLVWVSFDSDAFIANFDTFNGVYFTLDCICVTTILLLFATSVKKIAEEKNKGKPRTSTRSRGSAVSRRKGQRSRASRPSMDLDGVSPVVKVWMDGEGRWVGDVLLCVGGNVFFLLLFKYNGQISALESESNKNDNTHCVFIFAHVCFSSVVLLVNLCCVPYRQCSTRYVANLLIA